MHNTGEQDAEYGDNSCIMGNAKNWRGINAPHRMVLNWINPSNYRELAGACSDSLLFTLTSLHILPPDPEQPELQTPALLQSPQALTQVIMFPRHGGGTYYVSLRASAGYDSTLSFLWADKVTVHYHLDHSTNRQTNSQLVTVLAPGMQWGDAESGVVVVSAHSHIRFGWCNGSLPMEL